MATSKTTARTNTVAGVKRKAALDSGKLRATVDSHAYTTGQLAVNEVLLTDMKVPSNGTVREIKIFNEDLDSGSALKFDLGVYATEAYTSVTSGTATKHAADDIIDADLFCDGLSNLAVPQTQFTTLAMDTVTAGAGLIDTPVWSLLGYDEDPNTVLGIVITITTGPTGAQAGDAAFQVEYLAQ